MRDNFQKNQVFTRRAIILGSIKTALFSFLFCRYYYLQIIDAIKYKTLSDKNRIKISVIPPLRGTIRDRNGVDLATNMLSYRLSFTTRDITQIKEMLAEVNTIITNKIEISDNDIKLRLKKLLRSSPFMVSDRLSWEDVTKLEINSFNLPGILIDQGQRRYYNFHNITAHITGYIASPSKKELEKISIPNFNDFLVGKNGVEKILDARLRGHPGIKKAEVDALGNHVREISNSPSMEGESVKLAIDINIQKYAAEILSDKTGSIILIDIKTGEVLCLYSSPAYDPNSFVGGISTAEWNSIANDPQTPLINKAITALYPPGSTFKIVTALAALEHGISPDFKVFCNGKHKVGNRIFHCNRETGHGDVDVRLAIAQSCNVYFYVVAEKMGIKNIVKTAFGLGFGDKTNIELPYESRGNIPEPNWKFLKFSQKWTIGDTVNASIGQGFVLTTPIQLALMAARIASGKNISPTILQKSGQPTNLKFSPHNLDTIRKGMFMVFNDNRGNGYRHRISNPDFQICGKTGTAQVISARKTTKKHHTDHGLFLGFAPFEDPRYAISVIVEHGSWGSQSALPIAKEILLYAHSLTE
ncbi:penicillin-binding protein 2 [Candidatus Jidaibacter acanthamoebae]|nr:penicillin-binding protein 2 [Candidatus Jidaibacter acanthamoeba]